MKAILPHGLWITPSFSEEMEAGLVPPPRINHQSIQWEQILSALNEVFLPESQGVRMRLCDDTVDQVTIHMKEFGRHPGSIECLEFGDALQAKAATTKKSIVPIRSEWSDLHFIKERDQAPPPVMLPLVLSGDAADIILFVMTIRQRLSIKAASDLVGMIKQTPLSEDDIQGHLPPELMELFEFHFGVSYKSYSVVTPLVPIDPRII